MNFKRIITTVLMALVWLSATMSAFGTEVEIEGGLTHFTKIANGNWYQEGFPNTEHMTSVTAGLSVLTDKDANGLQYGVIYGNYGEASVESMDLDVDANYNPNSPTHCNGPCGPLSHLHGQGNIPYFGLELRKTFDEGMLKDVYVSVSAVDTRASWKITNDDWHGPGVPNYKFDTYHKVVNTYNLAYAIGYNIQKNMSVAFEFVPTHAPNSQPDPTNPTGTSYFPGIYKAYSPRIVFKYDVFQF